MRTSNSAGKLFLAIGLFVLVRPVCLRADDIEAAWKDLLIKGQRAAVAHDMATADQFLQKALHEAERFGSTDSHVGITLASLGPVQKALKHYAEAEASLRRALLIIDPDDNRGTEDVADLNFDLAGILVEEGKQTAAIPVFNKCLGIFQQLGGGESLKAAAVQCAIGDTYRSLRAYADAEEPLKRCAETREADGGVMNVGLSDALYSLAIVYEKLGKYALADPRYKLAEKIREKTLGIMSPAFAQVLESHAALLKQMGRDKEAAQDAALAAAIRRHERK